MSRDGDVENWSREAVVFSVIDSNVLGVSVLSPSGFTCASFVGSVLVAISDISIFLVLTGISAVLSISGVPVKIKVAIVLVSDSVFVVTAFVAVTVWGSVALSSLVESILIGCIFVEVSEVTVDWNNGETSMGEDKLTLDFVVPNTAVVLLPDVISVDCEEIFDDKDMFRNVVWDVRAENSVFPVVAVTCNFEAIVAMSIASGTGNEVSDSLITAKLVLDFVCETDGVWMLSGKARLSFAGSMPEIRQK